MSAATTSTVAGSQLLAHVGPLGHHDLWVVLPMAALSVVVMIVMARPRRPSPDGGEPDGESDGGKRDGGKRDGGEPENAGGAYPAGANRTEPG